MASWGKDEEFERLGVYQRGDHKGAGLSALVRASFAKHRHLAMNPPSRGGGGANEAGEVENYHASPNSHLPQPNSLGYRPDYPLNVLYFVVV